MDLATAVSDLFQLYRTFQEAHPALGTVLTAEATYLASDLASQAIANRRINGKKLLYTAALAPLYGAGIEALVQTGEVVGEYISNNPLTKAALGPNLFGIAFNSFFFVNNGVGEKTGYSLKALAKNYAHIFLGKAKSFWENLKENYLSLVPKREFAYSALSTVTIWNAIQFANYKYIPETMRTPTVLAASLVWLTILSLWSLRGNKSIPQTLPPPIAEKQSSHHNVS